MAIPTHMNPNTMMSGGTALEAMEAENCKRQYEAQLQQIQTAMGAGGSGGILGTLNGYNPNSGMITAAQKIPAPTYNYAPIITKITNGYLVRGSQYGDNGYYYCETAAAVGEYITSQLVIQRCQDE
jgi:hypothetical protein